MGKAIGMAHVAGNVVAEVNRTDDVKIERQPDRLHSGCRRAASGNAQPGSQHHAGRAPRRWFRSGQSVYDGPQKRYPAEPK